MTNQPVTQEEIDEALNISEEAGDTSICYEVLKRLRNQDSAKIHNPEHIKTLKETHKFLLMARSGCHRMFIGRGNDLSLPHEARMVAIAVDNNEFMDHIKKLSCLIESIGDFKDAR